MPLDKDWYSRGVLETCDRVHAHCTGTGDGIPDAEVSVLRDWMKRRLDGWVQSKGFSTYQELYECAVRLLLSASIEELDAWIALPKEKRDA